MEITRNVTEIELSDRQALERVLGLLLRDDQQVVVRILNRDDCTETQERCGQHSVDDESLPEWCNVFEGLSEEEVAAIEEVMLTRANLTRPHE